MNPFEPSFQLSLLFALTACLLWDLTGAWFDGLAHAGVVGVVLAPLGALWLCAELARLRNDRAARLGKGAQL